MNDKPIDQASTADLRGSWDALQRAARNARELAAQTGTPLVISRNGAVECIDPRQARADEAPAPPAASIPDEP